LRYCPGQPKSHNGSSFTIQLQIFIELKNYWSQNVRKKVHISSFFLFSSFKYKICQKLYVSCLFLIVAFTGLNFINVLHAAFTLADPKSVKRYWWLNWIFFTLLGSTSVKAAHKTLVKLTLGRPSQTLVTFLTINVCFFYCCFYGRGQVSISSIFRARFSYETSFRQLFSRYFKYKRSCRNDFRMKNSYV